MKSVDDSPTQEFIHQQLVSLVARHSRRIPLPVITVDLVIAALAYEAAGLAGALVWLALAAAVVVLRWRMLSTLPNRNDWDLARRVRVVTLLSGLGGVVFGTSTAFFPLLPLPEQCIMTLLLLGLAAGGVVTSGGHRVTYLAFAIPTVIPVAAMWIFLPGGDAVAWLERTIGLLVALYLWILLGICNDNWHLFQESCSIRFRESGLIESLQSALASADTANRAKTRFLAAASHDLRQPLHSLTMLAAALSLRKLDDRSQEMVSLMNEVTESLAMQLDGLLDISKLDAGIVQADMHPIRVTELVRQHHAEIEGLARAKNVGLRLNLQTEVAVRTDEQLLTRVLRNLTQNALRFTSSGEIVLRVALVNGQVILEVEDTGCGIPVEHREQVFQEFYQVDNPERDRSKGLGLGLSIVKRLCDLLEVKLTMQSEVGRGTRFSLALPIAEASEVPRAAPPLPDEQRKFSLAVLVVDDERPVRQALGALLKELGCQCVDCASTAEAAELIAGWRPDLVLADFRLRGDDNGLTVIRAVTARWAGVPAVLISGDTAPDRLQEAERAGVRLLHKPLPLHALREELRMAEAVRRQQRRTLESHAP